MKNFLTGLLLLIAMCAFGCYSDDFIKRPNVSGQFYPGSPKVLSGDIDSFFRSAAIVPSHQKIPLLIAPHAGYPFSGLVAAHAFKAASGNHYKTIVVIGPSHFVDFPGVAIWPQGSFETPLGMIDVDGEFAKKLTALSERISFIPKAFLREHSVEVELPFLQKTFKDFKIVPLLTGRPKYEDCAALASALDGAIGDRDDVLVVISTDMSHYFDDATARRMDYAAISLIKNLDANRLWSQCLVRNIEFCGFPGVETALLLAKQRGLNGVEVLKYANSGDVTGDKNGVVGYTAVAFYKNNPHNSPVAAQEKQEQGLSSLTAQQKQQLLAMARKTVEAYVKTEKVIEFEETDPRLSKKEGAFVTLRNGGQLRGCVGNIIGRGPLYQTVRDMTIAATQDDRFRLNPVKKEELPEIEIEISVLSEPLRVNDVNQIQMGTHGVIVSQGPFHHGLFLPQVATETGWTKERFLSELCIQKAGLPPDCWKDPKTTIEIFTADVFSEKDLIQ